MKKCRICHCTELVELLDLGSASFTGIFPKRAADAIPTGRLALVKCSDCSLVQLADSFELNQLYGMNYGYRSGLNQSMVRHLRAKVDKLITCYGPKDGDLIIDIGSNDSTLLQSYPKTGLTLVGIDPSGPKFRSYYPEHIELIPDFFTQSVVEKHLGNRKAKLITSIAMFYDLEDPSAFVREIAAILADDGVWTFEQSYLPMMLDTVSYDTICHEHLEYYALKQIKRMTDSAGLKIINIELNDVNGGSISISATKINAPYPEAKTAIEALLESEEKRGLYDLPVYVEFAKKTAEHRECLMALLSSLRSQGKKILGYGASTKGNVLLQYCGFTQNDLACIAEVNEDKFGSFTPGTRIPIVSESEARALEPDYFLVFPWHFRQGILQREKAFLEAGGQFIFPLPKIEIVSSAGSQFPTLANISSKIFSKPAIEETHLRS